MFCVNRKGWFYFRHRVPHDLIEVVGSTDIQCLLKDEETTERLSELMSNPPMGILITLQVI